MHPLPVTFHNIGRRLEKIGDNIGTGGTVGIGRGIGEIADAGATNIRKHLSKNAICLSLHTNPKNGQTGK
jgi:hypothetical protein